MGEPRPRRWIQTLLAVVMWMAPSAVLASVEHRAPDIRPVRPTSSRPAVRLRIPMTVHVATAADRPAADTRRILQAVNRTNQELAAHGIEVYIARMLVMPEGHAGVRGRRGMRRLAEFARPDRTVHVFFVQDVALAGSFRTVQAVRGLHWRVGGLRRSRLRDRELLVIGGDAPATTLVHELGHLFGLQHDEGRQNLMCSCRAGPRQIFTRAQGQQLQRGAVAFLRRGRA
jgi:hypothetical protein